MSWQHHIESLTKSVITCGCFTTVWSFHAWESKARDLSHIICVTLELLQSGLGTSTLENMHTIYRPQKRADRFIANLPNLHTAQGFFLKYRIIVINSVTKLCDFWLCHSWLFNHKLQHFTRTFSQLTVQHTDSHTRSSDKWLIPHHRANYNF